jgi:hypothetical protein
VSLGAGRATIPEHFHNCATIPEHFAPRTLNAHKFNALLVAGRYRQGSSSDRTLKDGVSTPAVIFALGPEESKEENDVPQLQDRMS